MPGYRSRIVKPTLVLWTIVVTIALAARVFTSPTATVAAILSVVLVGLGVLAWRYSGRATAAMVASRPTPIRERAGGAVHTGGIPTIRLAAAPAGYLGQHRARH